MNTKLRLSALAVVALGILMTAGCSHSQSATDTTSSAAASTTASKTPAADLSRPTAANIQTNMSSIQSNPNLSPAAKKLMMEQGQHALSAAQAKGPGAQ